MVAMTDGDRPDGDRVARATALAARLLTDAAEQTRPAEHRRAARLGRLLGDPAGRELLFALTDQVLRAPDPRRSVARLDALLRAGTPRAIGPLDRAGLRLAAIAGRYAPALVDRAVEARVRAETRGVILPATDPGFARHVAKRKAEGMDLNVNILGEAILGDEEADARLAAVCHRLARPDVACISVKISALCANLDVLAFEHSVARISERFRQVLRVAQARNPPKFVYLDMEEFRDLDLTVAAFQRVLDEGEFRTLPAGVALQAYLPDSHAVLDDIATWAGRRRANGGAWVKVRIVKGANLAQERVDAELAGWAAAPYPDKAAVDASYKRMVDRAFAAATDDTLHVGVASHNLFDVAWALTLRSELGLDNSRVEIEMLEGMAPAQARATRAAAGALLLYTPVVSDDDYVAAISYLSRRLDENAAPDNFLRALFSLQPGSADWEAERARFTSAVKARTTVSTDSRRTQDRNDRQSPYGANEPFANESDTDFTRAANRTWIERHLADSTPLPAVPLITSTNEVDTAVERANAGRERWSGLSPGNRRSILMKAAAVMSAARGHTIALMARETAKTVREGDTEVSEAIDMVRWAAASTHLLEQMSDEGVRCEPRGPVLVAAPWNFPRAIPTNGVVGALAAGTSVILKPAPEAVATGADIVELLRHVGVPPDAVQLLRTPDDDVGRHLVTHPGIDTVVLTGAYETASMFHDWKPALRLIAETSGKNALVITGAADLDLAIKDLVRSAFGHSGQKCSAASLAIVEAGIYDDPKFAQRLADAVRSVRVGAATELATMMGPLVQPAGGKLLRALTKLEPGERWLVEPRRLDTAGRCWSPGVKMDVQPGSFFHLTECFGPVLGLMRATDLDDALALQNAPEFGLTGGLHSLDPDEIEHWLARVQVGNAYVNRHTTGAIVRRQPFGGWKHSSVGPGAKAGGPNDVLRFVRCTPNGVLDVDEARTSFTRWWNTVFSRAIDESRLHAESNVLRYRPIDTVIVAAAPGTTAIEIDILRAAAQTTGVTLEVSPADDTDGTRITRLTGRGVTRLRALGTVSETVARACHTANIAIDDAPVTANGRVELPHWLREQAISRTLHRHGRVPTWG